MSAEPAAPESRKVIAIKLLVLVAIYFAIIWLLPRPAAVKPEGWRLLGIFLATVAGLMLHPLPGGAIVLIGVTAAALLRALPMEQALAGYSKSFVWLVLAAFFVSRALIKTGLARRIALLFVRAFGKSSLGLSYSLILSDVTLATSIPSNAARAGGVILPILRSLTELYGSLPGETASLLGTFLFVAVYQGECVAAAMFFTGQASNPLAANFAHSIAHFEVTWASWFVAGIVPGAICIFLVPWVISRLLPPKIRHTPEAPDFARRELAAMGPPGRAEKIVLVVFVATCGLWLTTSLHHIGITEVALLGACCLFLAGVLTWEDAISERAAWDVFIWYGGLSGLGEALNDFGVTTAFAQQVGAYFQNLGWIPLLAVTLVIYFYAHYAFASITTHILAMYPAFLALLLLRGAPAGLIVYAFACLSNLSAGLTHYGTTPSPMFYAHGYVSFADWWRAGFAVSIVNILIWCSVGFLWWKLIGIW
ncbi:MAG TPA: DASS family sodium-coupled anion symporter [Bryobacterales bacterium]|nr:DASS family sodium-coupled anion symporter [Bryobacterales bacterium]